MTIGTMFLGAFLIFAAIILTVRLGTVKFLLLGVCVALLMGLAYIQGGKDRQPSPSVKTKYKVLL